MPMTATISLLVSECLSGPMIGMPPPTLASKAMSTPAASAAAMTSSPWLASSALFAVTTLLPADSESSTTVRATPVPPMSSMMTSRLGSSMSSCGVGRALLGREAEVGEAVGVAVGEARELDVDARAAREVRAVTAQDLDHAGSDSAEADEADANGAHGVPSEVNEPHTSVQRLSIVAEDVLGE